MKGPVDNDDVDDDDFVPVYQLYFSSFHSTFSIVIQIIFSLIINIAFWFL